MKNQQGFETVKVAGTTEKIMQTIVCIVAAIAVAFLAIGVANELHDGHYMVSALWAISMVAALNVFVRFVVAWGESSKVK